MDSQSWKFNFFLLQDPDGNEVGTDESGELYARTGISMGGYGGDPDATRAASLEGLFSVGDMARRDSQGYYYIVGRSAHLIITGGVNVYPAEVEEALTSHPDVIEAAVVGMPDKQWGERITAVITAKPTVSIGSLRDWTATRLSKAQRPKDYRFWKTLPVSPQGKVSKKTIVQMLKDGRKM